MEVVFTRHAKARMRWRGITPTEVKHVLEEPERKEWLGPNRFHLYRKIGKRYIRVTCVVEEATNVSVVISVVDKSD